MVTTSFCSCNKFLCTENARFFREFCTKRTFPGKTGHFFHFSLFFVFAAVAGGGDSQRLFKDLCKIIHVQNAHFLGHGGNGVVVLHQQLGRAVDALGVADRYDGLMKHIAARLFSVSGSATFRLT